MPRKVVSRAKINAFRVPIADLLKDVLRNPLLTDDAPGQQIGSGTVFAYLSGADALGEQGFHLPNLSRE
jgi:hypothetical protein